MMYLSASLDYDWFLQITNDELTILQKVLRDETLTESEEARADKLSSTLDMIREKAERSRNGRGRKPRGRCRQFESAPDPELSATDYSA